MEEPKRLQNNSKHACYPAIERKREDCRSSNTLLERNERISVWELYSTENARKRRREPKGKDIECHRKEL